MKFSELIKAPEITLKNHGEVYAVVSSFNRVTIVYDVDSPEEQFHTIMKSNPLGKADKIYSAVKNHFKMEEDFFILENIPYKDLPSSAVEIGSKVGVLFFSNTSRFGGYAKILKRAEKQLANKGEKLVGKDALFISFPLPLMSANRRRRFRLHPNVEDYFLEISGFGARRDSPIQTFPIHDISDFGAAILLPGIPSDHIPLVGDTVYIRLNLFLAGKGYILKRGVVPSQAEVTEGKVSQQQFVLKCKVIHIDYPSERTTELGLEFLEVAREGISSDPKNFPRLTYVPIDESEGIPAMFGWVNKVQQLRRSEDVEKGIA